MTYTLGPNRQNRTMKAHRITFRQIIGVLARCWSFRAKKTVTNPSHMTEVVYIVNAMCFDSLKLAGIFLVLNA